MPQSRGHMPVKMWTQKPNPLAWSQRRSPEGLLSLSSFTRSSSWPVNVWVCAWGWGEILQNSSEVAALLAARETQYRVNAQCSVSCQKARVWGRLCQQQKHRRRRPLGPLGPLFSRTSGLLALSTEVPPYHSEESSETPYNPQSPLLLTSLKKMQNPWLISGKKEKWMVGHTVPEHEGSWCCSGDNRNGGVCEGHAARCVKGRTEERALLKVSSGSFRISWWEVKQFYRMRKALVNSLATGSTKSEMLLEKSNIFWT